MVESLHFHIPLVGGVSATLHEESERIYRWLCNRGEVYRLKQLDHLGAIRFAWEGAHHPRWEYVAFILSLIDHSKKEVPELHLSSNVRLGGSVEISSGSELLKCWALLLNAGHLVWTFFTERVLLLELWSNQSQRQEFLNYFSNESKLKDWAEQILRKGQIYRFFQALAFIRLYHLEQGETLGIPWKEILTAYVLDTEGPGTLGRLRKVYRRLRRVAYITLDPHYTPAAIQLNAVQLFSTKSFALSHVLDFHHSEADDALNSIERYLYRHIYLGEPVIRAMADREKDLRRLIRGNLRRKGFFDTLEQLAKGDIQKDVRPDHLSTVVRLPIWVEHPFHDIFLKALNPRTEEARLQSGLPKEFKHTIIPSLWPDAVGSSWVVQLHAPDGNYPAKIAAYRAAFEYVVRLKPTRGVREWNRILGEESIHNIFLGTLASELVTCALKLAFRERKDLRWEWNPIFEGPVAAIGTRKSLREFVKQCALDVKAPDAKAELQARLILLRRRPEVWVALSMGRLEAYEERKKVLELDGCLVELGNDGKIIVTLIEAKKRGPSDAKEQLKTTLNTLACKQKIKISTKKEKGIVVAFATIELYNKG